MMLQRPHLLFVLVTLATQQNIVTGTLTGCLSTIVEISKTMDSFEILLREMTQLNSTFHKEERIEQNCTNLCSKQPCMNGGKCVDKPDIYECNCQPGFTGPNCITDINECDSNPCLFGSCVQGVNTYKCMCPDDVRLTGVNCAFNSSTNMALHQSAYQSADADAVANHQPSAPRAVDGNRDTSWISGSCTALSGDGPGAPNWWVVDLAVPIHVDNVVVTNRGDCCPERLDNFIVGLTNTFDKVTNPPVRGNYTVCGKYPGPASAGARMTVQCFSYVTPFRYVIVQQPANGVGTMTICEVEVYGH